MIYRSIIKTLMRSFGSKLKSGSLSDAIQASMKLAAEKGDHALLGLLFCEQEYYGATDRKVYFVERDTARMLSEARLDLDFRSLITGKGTLSLTVGVGKGAEFVGDWTGHAIPPVLVSWDSEMDNLMIAHHQGSACYLQNMASQKHLDGLLAQGLDGHVAPLVTGSVPIDMEEQRFLGKVTRFWLSVLAYMKSNAAVIEDGLPEYALKCRELKACTNGGEEGASFSRVRLPARLRMAKGETIPHWRNPHLRSLRDKRYTRNADGSLRIVLVSGCVVGRAEPKVVR